MEDCIEKNTETTILQKKMYAQKSEFLYNYNNITKVEIDVILKRKIEGKSH